jgi:hypothetical protein
MWWKACSPGPMCGPTLFNDHRHNCIFIDFPSILVCTDDFIDADVANQITRDKDKITGDDPMRVNVTHRIPGENVSLAVITGTILRPLDG